MQMRLQAVITEFYLTIESSIFIPDPLNKKAIAKVINFLLKNEEK